VSRCDCEPLEHDDGSVTHEDTCPTYPWCPHEIGAYTCPVPCGCECNPCKALTPPIKFEKPTRRSSLRGRAVPRRGHGASEGDPSL
jgi:hypothetical protein